jgi:hypothetical protein
VARELPIFCIYGTHTGGFMANRQAINVGGEQHLVREDTAKAWRGVNWALLSIGAFILILALVFLSGLFTASNDGGVDRSPVEHQRDGAGRGN